MPNGASFVIDNDEFGQTRVRYAPAPYNIFYRQGDMNQYNLSKNRNDPNSLKEQRYEYDENLLSARPNTLLRYMTQESEEYFFNDPKNVFLRQPMGEPPRSTPTKRKSTENFNTPNKRARPTTVEDARARRRQKGRDQGQKMSSRSRTGIEPFDFENPLGRRKKMSEIAVY